MIDPLDEDGYPTEATLKRLETWPLSDSEGALRFMGSLWHFDGWGYSERLLEAEREVIRAEDTDKCFRFATGGWSGNESLISAYKNNLLLNAFTWRLTASGGLHIFSIRGVE